MRVGQYAAAAVHRKAMASSALTEAVAKAQRFMAGTALNPLRRVQLARQAARSALLLGDADQALEHLRIGRRALQEMHLPEQVKHLEDLERRLDRWVRDRSKQA
jgi:hypothetical protein